MNAIFVLRMLKEEEVLVRDLPGYAWYWYQRATKCFPTNAEGLARPSQADGGC
jgi:hypothetical protein